MKLFFNPKIILLVFGLVAITLVGLGLGKGATYFNPQAREEEGNMIVPVGETRKIDASTVAIAQVSIGRTGFGPATVKIKSGGEVLWTNEDTTLHSIASDPFPTHSLLPDLVSDDLARGDSYSYIFEKQGIYTYHDGKFPMRFRGVIIVE